MISGTIKSTVKLQMLDTKWQQKKNEINSNKSQTEMTAEERTIAQFQEQIDKERESNSHAETYNKLATGGKLTSEEISYLQEHDPEALAKYREAQAEQKAYENELKNCKTKDEVERVKMNRMGNFAAEAKKISNDPYIPLDKKLELMNQLNNEVCLVNEAHQEFVKSNQYRDMPTDEELSKERIEEASEEQEKMQSEVMKSVSDEPEDTEENDSIQKQKAEIEETLSVESADESAEQKVERAKRERRSDVDTDEPATTEMSYEKISDSIRNFVISFGNQNRKVDISV